MLVINFVAKLFKDIHSFLLLNNRNQYSKSQMNRIIITQKFVVKKVKNPHVLNGRTDF